MSKLKRTYFLGAGSTKYLGMKATVDQNKLVQDNLFCEIDDNSKYKDYKELSEFLKRYFIKETFTMQDCFNFIDYLLQDDRTLWVNSTNQDKKVYDFIKLTKIRQDLINFILEDFKELIKICDNEKLEKLIKFYYKLGKMELENRKTKSGKAIYDIETEYSIINTNWDIYSLIPMMQAHERLNKENDNYYSGDGYIYQLRLYSSFSNVNHTTFKKDDNSGFVKRFPFTPHMAHVFNDERMQAKRKIIATNTFFPHGLMNMYVCPVCHNVCLHINYDDELTKNYEMLSSSEDKTITCPSCEYNNMTNKDRLILMQSNFKEYGNFAQSIQNDMMHELSNSKEIIFIGYSLPIDDVDYLTKLRVAVNSGKLERVKIVLLNPNFHTNHFIKYEDVDKSIITEEQNKILENYTKIFEKDKIYINFAGAPDCFECDELYE